nr:retrovirus-related Pol polyprotein from transposon TNT 1-94 [Tanacetum cinerariifolium]
MAKQCTKPKRKRNDAWFQDKVLLVQAQGNGQILHEEELAFLADPGIAEVKLVVEIESFGMNYEKFDMETMSFGDLQQGQVDLDYVDTLDELHFHVVHVVPSKNEDDQHW